MVSSRSYGWVVGYRRAATYAVAAYLAGNTEDVSKEPCPLHHRDCRHRHSTSRSLLNARGSADPVDCVDPVVRAARRAVGRLEDQDSAPFLALVLATCALPVSFSVL